MKFAKFLRAPYFTEYLQWLPLAVSGFQPATLLKDISLEILQNLKEYLLKEHLQMTAFCVYL